ncbi:hypothetical protein OG883_44760 [Streptomyces sp. NBC_01142]|uniref:hypothetical protein n=1 Tax=Streptomyces sp. NBC_01142 TaxID=2975865 RepID=UPI0022574E9A|nr:hypothetical protein [Streptomyces sp. NBC_01142]MCX4826758.1 hypothetical protein [Streptomyces sp. NBC_01142]
MPITTQEQARDAARPLSEAGPIAEFAGGDTPGCFARLRLALAGMRRESLATSAMLDMTDGPDDPLMERGKEEVAEITSAIGALLAWVEEQFCEVEVCECRADRLLRHLLEEAHVPGQTGYSPQLGRNSCIIAGSFVREPDERMAYVLIEHRNHIEHAVRAHRGWRARLVTADGVTPLYESPGYPETPVSVYREDTLGCVRAVADALYRAA